MVTEIELFAAGRNCSFCSWEVYKRKVDARDEWPTSILGTTARIKKCEGQLRQITRDLCTQFAKYTEVKGIIEQ